MVANFLSRHGLRIGELDRPREGIGELDGTTIVSSQRLIYRRAERTVFWRFHLIAFPPPGFPYLVHDHETLAVDMLHRIFVGVGKFASQ